MIYNVLQVCKISCWRDFWLPEIHSNADKMEWRFPGIGHKKFLEKIYENFLGMGYKKFLGPGPSEGLRAIPRNSCRHFHRIFLWSIPGNFRGFSSKLLLGVYN